MVDAGRLDAATADSWFEEEPLGEPDSPGPDSLVPVDVEFDTTQVDTLQAPGRGNAPG